MKPARQAMWIWAGLLLWSLPACKRAAPPSQAVTASSPAATVAAPAVVAPPGGPKVAGAENGRGMKLYKARDYAGAAAAFRAAIAADPGHVLAHYNLACVLALTGDRAGAIAMLEWLAQSASAQAARCLTKAAVDRDLTVVRGDPKVQGLIAAAAAKMAAAAPTDDKLLPPMPPVVREVRASSTASDKKNPARYAAKNALFYTVKGGRKGYESDATPYSSRFCVEKADGGVGESLTFTLSSPSPIDKLRIAAGAWESAALFARHNRITRLDLSVDGKPAQAVTVPAGRSYAEFLPGKDPAKSVEIRIAAVEKGADNLSCLSAVQLYRDNLPEEPLDAAADPALGELFGALLAMQKALRDPGKDFAKLDSLLAFPFRNSDGSCFLSMACDSSKTVTHKSLPDLAKSCRRFEKLSEEKRHGEGNPCPEAASVDGEDSRPLSIATPGPGRVTIAFPSHNEVCTQWSMVHREGSWRLSEIGFEAGTPDDDESGSESE
jgi:tetratricopeptide (TPR) repeat protein